MGIMDRPSGLVGEIYTKVKNSIDRGEIDDRNFLNEGQLAEQFGSSKGSVKVALQILCSQGYLVSYPRKGYMVHRFTKEEVNQMQVIRKQIEMLSVRLVIAHATDDDIRSLYQYTEEKSESDDPINMNNTLFHLHLAKISGNAYLEETLEPLLCRASRIMVGEKSDSNRHKLIIDALLERNLNVAQARLDEDIKLL